MPNVDHLLRNILCVCLRPAAEADAHHQRASVTMQIVPAPKKWELLLFPLFFFVELGTGICDLRRSKNSARE
jgi:hypothetical protein